MALDRIEPGDERDDGGRNRRSQRLEHSGPAHLAVECATGAIPLWMTWTFVRTSPLKVSVTAALTPITSRQPAGNEPCEPAVVAEVVLDPDHGRPASATVASVRRAPP